MFDVLVLVVVRHELPHLLCHHTGLQDHIYRLFMADMAQWIGAASLAERILPPEEREGLI